MHAVQGTSAVAPVNEGGRLRALGRDLDNFFRRGVPTADVTATVAQLLAQIDWTAPTIVLWIPGTNQPGVPERVRSELARRGLRAPSMPYMASWQLTTSIADGERTFRALLDQVAKRRRPGQRIIVLGESQGAWIASNVLLDPTYAAIVDRTALIAHPGIAPNHAHGTNGGPQSLPDSVMEFNDAKDATTRYLGVRGGRALGVIEAASTLRLGDALVGAALVAFTNLEALKVLFATQTFRAGNEVSPHASGSPYSSAIDWALAAR